MAHRWGGRYPPEVKPFSIIHKDAVQHGIVLGVSLPDSRDPVPMEILEQLHPEERAYALDLRGFRQVHWVGGRLAARSALQLLGCGGPPILTDPWGAPTSRQDLSISISHKRHMAVALVARHEHGSLGVDLEDLSPAREGIERRVLRPEELAEVEELPAERRWISTLIRFSIKEAIYKSLAPKHRRYIDFREAAVFPGIDGSARVQLFLEQGPHPEQLDARYVWLHRSVLSSVRARWAP
jgi:enterobactin synthetase component D